MLLLLEYAYNYPAVYRTEYGVLSSSSAVDESGAPWLLRHLFPVSSALLFIFRSLGLLPIPSPLDIQTDGRAVSERQRSQADKEID